MELYTLNPCRSDCNPLLIFFFYELDSLTHNAKFTKTNCNIRINQLMFQISSKSSPNKDAHKKNIGVFGNICLVFI